MTYPNVLSGQDITADLLNSMLTKSVAKTAFESVTSSTTLQNDDTLFLSVEANATYAINFSIFHDSDPAGDIKIGWTAPSGSAFDWAGIGVHNAVSSSGTVTDVTMQTRTLVETQDLGGGTSTGTIFIGSGVLITSSTAGTIQLQWAQRVSNATATRVRPGSSIIMNRVA